MAIFQISSSIILLAVAAYHAFKALAMLRKEIKDLGQSEEIE
jgi:hypothetical protein